MRGSSKSKNSDIDKRSLIQICAMGAVIVIVVWSLINLVIPRHPIPSGHLFYTAGYSYDLEFVTGLQTQVKAVPDVPNHHELSLSPDGQWRLITVSRSGSIQPVGSDLWRVNVVTDEQERLTDSVSDEMWASFSPDGATIAYVAIDKQGYKRLYVMSLHTHEITPLAPYSIIADPPVWSPDGQWLAFTTYHKNDWGDIEIAHINGRDNQVISRYGTPGYPLAWLP